MRNSILFIMISSMIVLFAAAASAETTVLRFDFELFSNDTVVLKNIVTSLGTFEEIKDENRPYQILLIEGDDVMHLLTFDETFLRMTDPPSVVEKKLISKKLPYLGNVGELHIYHEDNLIFKYNMKDLCNHDKICSGFENEIVCPEDCTVEMREKAEKIKILADEKIEEEEVVEDRQEQFFIFLGILCMIIALLLIIILTKHKKKGHGKR